MSFKSTFAAVLGVTGHVVSAFRNPIIGGVNADPSAIRVGDDYFLATSSFEYFPGIPVYHSKDLVNWEIASYGLSPANGIYDRQLLTTGGIFAPTIRHHNGTFYLITNYATTFDPSDQRPFVVTTTDVFGNWSQPVWFDQLGIDPDLFFDDDGSVYLSTALPENAPLGGNSSIWQSKVDIETGHSLEQPKEIYRSELPLKIRWAEGSHLYKINGYYYLSVAEGGTDVAHRQMIARGPSPSGPWERSPLGPMVYNGRDPSLPIQQTGHADLVQRPDGKWYTVFLAIRPQLPTNLNGTYQLGRETFLSPVTWSQDGWPLANNGSVITFEMDDPSLPQQPESTVWKDDFSSHTLKHGWEFRTTPYGNWYRLENNSLIIRGNQRSLSALDGIALITKKQTELHYQFGVDLEFQPSLETHEAGLTAWINDEFHNSVSVLLCKNSNSTYCVRTMTIAQGPGIDGNVTTTYTPLSEHDIKNGVPSVRLYVRSTPETYQLGYSSVGSTSPKWLTAFSAAWMAPRSGGRLSFQGARMGLYATGNGVTMIKDATFRNAEAITGSHV